MNRSYFKYILSLLLFGFNGIIASFISLNSYEIVFSRALIGSMFLIAVLCFSPQKSFFTQILREKKKSLLYLIMSGAAMGASWMFLYEAYEQIGVSMATLAYYCGPVIVIVLAPVVFGEKITLPAVGGFLAVMLGMLLLNGADLSSGRMSWGLY